jgi:hypothetical protein
MVGPERKGIVVALFTVLPEHLRRRIGDERGSGGSAKLVSNDAQFLALAGQTENGFEETGPVGAEDPTGAENKSLAPLATRDFSPASFVRP